MVVNHKDNYCIIPPQEVVITLLSMKRVPKNHTCAIANAMSTMNLSSHNHISNDHVKHLCSGQEAVQWLS